MVRLKVFTVVGNVIITSYFNSNMVRLKVWRIKGKHPFVGFQFQYGSIKSYYISQRFVFFSIFQFQYGSIKSDTPKSKPEEIRNFNSNMVRLKVSNSILCSCRCINFNSNMVRLKATIANDAHHNFIISIPIWFD